jgi:hypothetical protein
MRGKERLVIIPQGIFLDTRLFHGLESLKLKQKLSSSDQCDASTTRFKKSPAIDGRNRY